MPQLPVTTIQGLVPLIDPTRIPDPHVVAGQNFYLDADGPLSGFSRRLLVPSMFANADGIQAIRVDEDAETFYFTRTGIYEWDSVSRSLITRYVFMPALQDDFPWTYAICGGKEYYARKGVGYLERDPQTGIWQLPPSVANADKIVAVAQSAGRLIAITTDGNYVAWSAIDDGLDFTPSLETGAGAQVLSPLALTNLDTQLLTVLEYELGFIVYTTRGLMRFERVDAAIPFRFKVLTRQLSPINPWVVVTMGDYEHVFLDINGFYSTRGEAPTPWQPLFSEYLHAQVLPNLDLSLRQILRLTNERDRNWVVLSLAQASQQTLYSKAFVLYQPSDQWGCFNRPHKGLVSVHRDEGAGFFEFGYIDGNNSLWQFTDTAIDEIQPNARAGLFIEDWRAPIEWPARRSTISRAVFTAGAHMVAYDPTLFTDAGFWDARRVLETTPLAEIGEIDVSVDDASGLTEFSISLVKFPISVAPGAIAVGFRISGPVLGALAPTKWFGIDAYQFVSEQFKIDEIEWRFGAAPGLNKVAGISRIRMQFTALDAPMAVFQFIPGLFDYYIASGVTEMVNYVNANIDKTVAFTLRSDTQIFSSRGRAESRIRRIRTATAAITEGALASFIDIGVFRGGFGRDVDELSLLHEISIGALAAGARDVFEDYIGDYTAEDFIIDWTTIADNTEDEDWGFGASDYSRYTLMARGTLDGQTKWKDQEKIPVEQLRSGGYVMYSTHVTGLHHIIRVEAFTPGDTYHIKTLELGIEPAGRLT